MRSSYGFSDQLISFAALGFQRLGRCSAREFPKSLLAIPPVKEIKTGPGIPDVTVARAHERHKFPAPSCVLNFLMMRTRLTVTMNASVGQRLNSDKRLVSIFHKMWTPRSLAEA